jgi:hypothetical protein
MNHQITKIRVFLPCYTVLLAALLMVTLAAPLSAQVPSVDLRTFVTTYYYDGLPYEEAKAYGPGALPELFTMLEDPTLEEYWPNMIHVVASIGDASAVPGLLDFIDRQSGEISVHTFRATLSVFSALGHLARSGDGLAFATLKNYADPDYWRVAEFDFNYQRYEGGALGEVLGRVAIQGLGFSARVDALLFLNEMNDNPNLRADWRDNVEEAIDINVLITTQGPEAVFGRGEDR